MDGWYKKKEEIEQTKNKEKNDWKEMKTGRRRNEGTGERKKICQLEGKK